MNSRIGSPFYLFFLNPDHVASRSLLLLSAAMSSALTREYAERTLQSKTSLDAKKLNNRKKDSEAYQRFLSEGFYLGFLRKLSRF